MSRMQNVLLVSKLTRDGMNYDTVAIVVSESTETTEVYRDALVKSRINVRVFLDLNAGIGWLMRGVPGVPQGKLSSGKTPTP